LPSRVGLRARALSCVPIAASAYPRQVQRFGSTINLCAKPATQLCALSKIQATQNDTGRSAFELHCKNLASGTLFDLIAQPDELRFALIGLCRRRFVQFVHRGGADGTGYLPFTVKHRKQDHHPFKFVTGKAAACQCHAICLPEDVPAFGAMWLSDWCVFHAFSARRIELGDLAKAIGLGIVWSGDKGSAHFRTVPTGYDAKPKRLFCLNVTRRKVLHGGWTFKLAFDLLIEREPGAGRQQPIDASIRKGNLRPMISRRRSCRDVFRKKVCPTLSCALLIRIAIAFSMIRPRQVE
jgi:hypothetical protein